MKKILSIEIPISSTLEIESAMNKTFLTVNDSEDVTVVEIEKQHAEQIIDALKKQFDL